MVARKNTRPVEELFKEMLYSSDGRRSEIREQIILSNMGLVRSIAGKYAGRAVSLGYDPEDLVQTGTVGLINAVDRYDPNRRVKFATYATPTIDGEIQRYFRDTNPLRRARPCREQLKEYGRIMDVLAQTLGRTPTFAEVADEMGLSEKEAAELYAGRGFQRPSSLEASLCNEELGLNSKVSDFIEEERSLTLHERSGQFYETAAIEEAIGRLPERLRTIIELRYFRGYSQTQTAQELGISQMHVSRLQYRALKGLRYHLEPGSKDKPEPEQPRSCEPMRVGLRERVLNDGRKIFVFGREF